MSSVPVVLSEWLAVDTPQGPGHAFAIEFGENDNRYTVILRNRAIVTFPQDRVLACKSYTHRRGMNDDELRKAIDRYLAVRAL